MPGKKPPGTGDGFTDPYPRVVPPETEEPANWKMVKLHLKLAAESAAVEEKDRDIVNSVEYHLNKALGFLHPQPAAA